MLRMAPRDIVLKLFTTLLVTTTSAPNALAPLSEGCDILPGGKCDLSLMQKAAKLHANLPDTPAPPTVVTLETLVNTPLAQNHEASVASPTTSLVAGDLEGMNELNDHLKHLEAVHELNETSVVKDHDHLEHLDSPNLGVGNQDILEAMTALNETSAVEDHDHLEHLAEAKSALNETSTTPVADHGEHHLEHLEAMNALKEALVEIDAAIAAVGQEGNETAIMTVMTHLGQATAKLTFAVSKEGGPEGHGVDGSHSEESADAHEHTAAKLMHAMEHLEEAVTELSEHAEGESAEAHQAHTTHALKCLMIVKQKVSEALAGGLRSCAMDEVEHALRDLLQALVVASGPTPQLSAPKLKHAMKDLAHAKKDLLILTLTKSPHHQDKHALHEINHAMEVLKEAIDKLDAGELEEGRELMKHITHSLKDIKCASTDLHIAHSLHDLLCALHDIEHMHDHEGDANELGHMAECIENDMKHAAKVAVHLDHLPKARGARIYAAASKVKKNPSAERTHKAAKKVIEKSIKIIKAKTARRHKEEEMRHCQGRCSHEYHKCLSSEMCKTMAMWANNSKHCDAENKKCTKAYKQCRACCKPKNHDKSVCKEHHHHDDDDDEDADGINPIAEPSNQTEETTDQPTEQEPAGEVTDPSSITKSTEASNNQPTDEIAGEPTELEPDEKLVPVDESTDPPSLTNITEVVEKASDNQSTEVTTDQPTEQAPVDASTDPPPITNSTGLSTDLLSTNSTKVIEEASSNQTTNQSTNQSR
eukprot:gnl/MRDRNA2_/MRDRNA2_90409_c0_seq1.p1 gnl/MRDRNA2_/MRDRNA2_90409_c0~~gnl/MRDRNA2_/MRDRNA2_90409_c0_seq1.p1  ORF type:complete len:762 (-),score=194.54 gnl/MRDRNA2_/MRDRNA2_90409_c0_seq1:95-2380(-)